MNIEDTEFMAEIIDQQIEMEAIWNSPGNPWRDYSDEEIDEALLIGVGDTDGEL